MDIYLNWLIQSHLNSTINLQLNALYRVLPTKCRSCRDHRLCDVTSPPYWLRMPERNLLSLPSSWWLTSPAGWLQRTGISSGTLRSAIEYVHCMVPHHLTWRRHSHVSPTCRTGSGPPPLKGEVTSQSPWSRYNCHLVCITWHNAWVKRREFIELFE